MHASKYEKYVECTQVSKKIIRMHASKYET